MAIPRITVLISGRGSNLAALIDAEREGSLGGAVSAVISSRPDAAGLAIARRHGIATEVIDARAFADREACDVALAAAVDASEPDLVVLAGFMRILGAAFVRRYEGRMLNIHPSLLPAYPGLDTHRRALADGARVHGCTVHYVTPEVDHGPIVAQRSSRSSMATIPNRSPRACSRSSISSCPPRSARGAKAGTSSTGGGIALRKICPSAPAAGTRFARPSPT